ncbi:MAG: hypothetical protein K2I89_01555, partial [Muribaculaceae bacterium]|nr:hypothetical protein [Muribaculaceae bacterium]
GTHFFHNLTSFGVGYFTINPHSDDGIYNIDYLDAQPAIYESERLRAVRFEKPLTVAIDGRKGAGVVFRPDRNPANSTELRNAAPENPEMIEQ